ncbi:pentatricopeptide repeat-containing protein At4g20770 [Cornus florida]|uniref:pentatricopeptide repeat-containing protein At4g20770 n=1 Tax=Cornus florida TaxID=4283 RepID=UPI0028A24E42|nr:pentatricopeptide repeat-containing protein At4g20770 [Cornus florida]XP_059666722.1 pentatricopeptide repeat-containing protein At4g20770 [Cornus florida]XP_059666731.1 pentatricopeptide repeat-containing protein At4g20770 [Cornus florida]
MYIFILYKMVLEGVNKNGFFFYLFFIIKKLFIIYFFAFRVKVQQQCRYNVPTSLQFQICTLVHHLTMESKTITYLSNLLQSCIDKKAHLAGKLLHARILRIGLFANTFLLNRLVEFYSKCGQINTSRLIFDQTPQKNIYSWHAMLHGYCEAKRLEDAHELFVEMPERSTVSWNTLISALVRSGFDRKALDVYYMMNMEGLIPTRFTLASVLSACGALVDMECGRECHCVSIKVGLDKNMYVGNALLSMYAKCRLIGDAIRALEDLPELNEVSFTAMMGGLAETDRAEEAFNMFRLMHRTGICIDSISLSSVLGVCARGTREVPNQTDGFSSSLHGQQIHGLTIKLGFERDLHLNNSLLDMYAKNGNMDSAEMIFTNLPEVSVVSWNVMIGGYGQNYQTGKAIKYMQKMQSQGFEPDERTYINMLAACIISGDIKTARQIFERMACPNLSSWNALLSGYSQNENHREAIKLFREMQFRGIQPDRTTLAIILSSCAGLGLLEGGKQVHVASLKAFLHTDVYVASGLIGLYSKCNKTEEAKCIFDRMPELDIVCWNAMISGLSLNSLDKEAFTFFRQMLGQGMFPTQFSYATVLTCCSKQSSLSQGRQVHAKIAKDGYTNDVFVGSALIDMYCKCGDVDGARQFFGMMPCKNSVTWNEMIYGYAQNGRGDEAVCLYEDMIGSGERPDVITFVSVLTACSHSGLVDTGIRIFNSMQLEHGVEPLVDHYTCVIDSLGRAGRFSEAEVFLDKMPCKDDPIIWEVLLSSCRVHGNVTLAKRAAEELFRLDPQNSTPYVLLSNIYFSSGRWDDASAVRKMMIDKQVIKDPGYSWG